MTSVAAAAAVLSIVSSSFKLLDGCVQAFQFIDTALHPGKHAGYLRCSLLLEEHRLISWAKYSGLSEDKLDKRLNRSLIDETLGNLGALLSDLDTLKTRYKLNITFEAPVDVDATAKVSRDQTFAFLNSESLIVERKRILERNHASGRRVGLHKKFWFAAVDKDGFEGLIRQIHTLVDGLRALLNDAQQAALVEEMMLLRLQGINTATKLDQLEPLRRALEVQALPGQQEVVVSRLKSINVTEIKTENADDLRDLMKHIPLASHSSLQPIFEGNFSKERPTGTSGLLALRNYDGLPVFVEWKRYDWAIRDEETMKKALSSISSLALLLNAPKTSKFRTLHCMGVLPEERSQRCQFVFSWPEGCDQDVEPKSLHSYLSSSYTPSLSLRIQLAKELAGSIFLLHSANWLHKAFSSSNILFFPERIDSDRSLRNPFIIGFDYSRPDIPGQPSYRADKDPSTDIYRHPAYLNDNSVHFHKIFDIYSLGLVLIEIIKWRPLKALFIQSACEHEENFASRSAEEKAEFQRVIWKECSVQRIRNMREDLIDTKKKNGHPTDIEFRAGSIVNEVVLWCLSAGSEYFRQGEDNGQKLQDAFFSNVLKKLEKCVI